MPRQTLRYCAEQFATQWRHKEQALVHDLKQGDPARRLGALQRAAGYFRVARNFPLAYDVKQGRERLAPALEVLDQYRSVSLTPGTLLAMVDDLRRKLAGRYGKTGVLSAATKFLWLLHKDPVVIYDSQARIALNAPDGDYEKYLQLWHESYATLAPDIADACESLTLDEAIPRGREWFRRRVFDIHLWNAGTPHVR